MTKAERIDKIREDFRKEMEKLGLGVKIKAGDGEWVTVAEVPPKKRPVKQSPKLAEEK